MPLLAQRALPDKETTQTGLRPATKRPEAQSCAPPKGSAYVEVLGTQGAQPLANWKVTGPAKSLQKVGATPAY